MEYSSNVSEIHVFPTFCNAIRSTLHVAASSTGNNFNFDINLLAKHSYTSGGNTIEEYHIGTRWGDKYKSLTWDTVDTFLLSETDFPYPLERVKWDPTQKILEKKDDLIKQILEFARMAQNVTPPFQDDDTVHMSLVIVKKVYVSPQEFEDTKIKIVAKQYDYIAQILLGQICHVINELGQHGSSLYEQLQWLEGCIENNVREIAFWSTYYDENYERKLIQDLIEHARKEFKSLPTVRSIMQSLQRVNIPENESTNECSICIGSYMPGSESYSMPCSHNFHLDCIETWLLKNPSCPMCRYMLPPSEPK
ncbi:hypothetical protein P3S68_007706 [Capsicum galapagoense]